MGQGDVLGIQSSIGIIIMGKSKKGGVNGFIRGRVGAVSYSVLSAKNSASGKKEQIIRILPDSVANPQTTAQCLQRMKITPAQRFYAALSVILSNSFQGVNYGVASRRYFMALAMKKTDGPYIRKEVDRFLPAEYTISEGEITSIKINRPDANEAGKMLLNYFSLTAQDEYMSNAQFAELLGVSENTQITVIVITNENGLFVPHYAGFDSRIRIVDLPAETVKKSQTASAGGGNISIDLSKIGLPTANVVAYAAILSVQDASGNWLRSTQQLVLNQDMYIRLYGVDALNDAVASYQSNVTVNSFNSEWYLNLGLHQAYSGRLTVSGAPVALPEGDTAIADYVVGNRQEQSGDYLTVVRDYFATTAEDTGVMITVVNGSVSKTAGITRSAFLTKFPGTSVRIWDDAFATQLGF